MPFFIERHANLSRADFQRDYLHANRPVILEGLVDQWPARHLWTPDYLIRRVGDATVEVMANRDADTDYEINCNRHRTPMPFSTYVNRAFFAAGNDTYMVANNRFLDDAGRVLLADVPAFPEYLYPYEPGRTFLWFGPAGTVTPLHYDSCDILLCQVRGAKRVRFYDPAQRGLLYNNRGVFSDVNYEAPDLARFPLFARAVAVECVLGEGEALFIPVGWFHQVRSLAASISVSFTGFIR
jgi:hypothetical protein